MQTDPIGSTMTSMKRRNQSLKKSLIARGTSVRISSLLLQLSSVLNCAGNSQEEIDSTLRKMSSDQLVSYNPLLEDYTPATRIAYAKFKSKLQQIEEPADDE